MVASPASRRAFLARLGTASLVGGTALVTPAAATPAADVELLQLGTDLDRAVATYLAVSERKAAAVVRFRAIEPRIPPEIVRKYPTRGVTLFQGEGPPNPDGEPSRLWIGQYPFNILWPSEAASLVQRLDERTRDGRLMRKLKPIADRYHSDHEAAREAVNLPAIQEDRYYAGRAIDKIARAACERRATTWQGLAVAGRANLALHRVRTDDRMGQRMERNMHALLCDLARLDGRDPLAIDGEGGPCA